MVAGGGLRHKLALSRVACAPQDKGQPDQGYPSHGGSTEEQMLQSRSEAPDSGEEIKHIVGAPEGGHQHFGPEEQLGGAPGGLHTTHLEAHDKDAHLPAPSEKESSCLGGFDEQPPGPAGGGVDGGFHSEEVAWLHDSQDDTTRTDCEMTGDGDAKDGLSEGKEQQVEKQAEQEAMHSQRGSSAGLATSESSDVALDSSSSTSDSPSPSGSRSGEHHATPKPSCDRDVASPDSEVVSPSDKASPVVVSPSGEASPVVVSPSDKASPVVTEANAAGEARAALSDDASQARQQQEDEDITRASAGQAESACAGGLDDEEGEEMEEVELVELGEGGENGEDGDEGLSGSGDESENTLPPGVVHPISEKSSLAAVMISKSRFETRCWDCTRGPGAGKKHSKIKCRVSLQHKGPDWKDDEREVIRIKESEKLNQQPKAKTPSSKIVTADGQTFFRSCWDCRFGKIPQGLKSKPSVQQCRITTGHTLPDWHLDERYEPEDAPLPYLVSSVVTGLAMHPRKRAQTSKAEEWWLAEEIEKDRQRRKRSEQQQQQQQQQDAWRHQSDKRRRDEGHGGSETRDGKRPCSRGKAARMADVEREMQWGVFKCPLTDAEFVDPVLCIVDGQTYEREAIVQFIHDIGAAPRNGQAASTRDLVDNIGIKACLREARKLRGEIMDLVSLAEAREEEVERRLQGCQGAKLPDWPDVQAADEAGGGSDRGEGQWRDGQGGADEGAEAEETGLLDVLAEVAGRSAAGCTDRGAKGGRFGGSPSVEPQGSVQDKTAGTHHEEAERLPESGEGHEEAESAVARVAQALPFGGLVGGASMLAAVNWKMHEALSIAAAQQNAWWAAVNSGMPSFAHVAAGQTQMQAMPWQPPAVLQQYQGHQQAWMGWNSGTGPGAGWHPGAGHRLELQGKHADTPASAGGQGDVAARGGQQQQQDGGQGQGAGDAAAGDEPQPQPPEAAGEMPGIGDTVMGQVVG